MKKVILVLSILTVFLDSYAQVKAPQASPEATISQVVGLTKIEIVYHRPKSKGRKVFGDLVPYGKIWRTGANDNTTISFNNDVVINGKVLTKGRYSLYTLPKADNWDVIFYKTTDNWGVPETWNEENVMLKTNVKPSFTDRKLETFTISFGSFDFDSTIIELAWESTIISFKVEVPTRRIVSANIDKVLAGPTFNDYYNASMYYYESNLDYKKALEYADKAIAMVKIGDEVPFWHLRLKSLIQAKLNDKAGAIATAKLSLAGAISAESTEYIKMNTDSINEWSKK